MGLDNFLKLPQEKQDHILHCALQEFATYGYELASTNRIVKAAGISKGVLFKYFQSKENLFYYLVDYYLTQEKASMAADNLCANPFDYMKALLKNEYQLYTQDKSIELFYRLYVKMVQNQNHPVYKEALERYAIDDLTASVDEYLKQLQDDALLPGVTRETVFASFVILNAGVRQYFRDHLDDVFQTDQHVLHTIFAAIDAMQRGLLRQ